jgi:hypothetical protein
LSGQNPTSSEDNEGLRRIRAPSSRTTLYLTGRGMRSDSSFTTRASLPPRSFSLIQPSATLYLPTPSEDCAFLKHSMISPHARVRRALVSISTPLRTSAPDS